LIYGIYSSGGFAREIKRSLVETKAVDEVLFIDDDESAWGTRVNGCDVISWTDLLAKPDTNVCIALADPRTRRKVAHRCSDAGLSFFSIQAQTSIVGENVEIGPGSILAEYSMITADAKIGRHFHANIFAYVAHDCIVGDFVTLSPRVSLNGRIVVEDDVYVGSDATFLPGQPDRLLTIGRGAVIGAGAVVTKDVAPGVTVVGAPARPVGN